MSVTCYKYINLEIREVYIDNSHHFKKKKREKKFGV